MKIRNTMKIRTTQHTEFGKRTRRADSRQGITLLFVVSMIVLFLLMGTAFVVVSNDYFRASRTRIKAKIYTVDRTALVHKTFYNLVRGPELEDIFSPFRGHDLLSDQYGFGLKAYVNYAVDMNGAQSSPIAVNGDATEAQLGVRVTNPGGEFIQIALASEVTDLADPLPTAGNPLADANEFWPIHNPTATAATGFEAQSDLYAGSVITFTTGPAKGLSTRIARHKFNPDDGHHYFWITPVWSVRAPVAVANLQDSQVIINGREFAGIGAGSYVDGTELGPEALLPNRVGESLADFRTNYMGSAGAGTPWRSFNESYDAADYQNMSLSGRNASGVVIASFHRQKLYQFIWDNTTNTNQIAATARANFRPRFIDLVDNNTGMTPGDGIADPGSTANGNYPYNQNAGSPASVTNLDDDLDADTDFDGNNDAVFIDPGYDVITKPDGRKFKPLVAIRIEDMGGRFNLNVHSNLTQARNDRFIATFSNRFAPGFALPSGEGFGPAEINLSQLDPTLDAATGTFVPNYADVGSFLASRYGSDGVPGDGGTSGKSIGKLFGYPADTVDIVNGQFGTLDRDATYATNQFGSASSRTLFASMPMNIHGRFSMTTPDFARINLGGTDYSDFRDRNYGNGFSNALPVIDMYETQDKSLFEFVNNPYEMSFAPSPFGDANDTPFAPRELERIFRQFDLDANMLPGRLLAAKNWGTDTDLTELVTTESYEIPTIPRIFKELLIDRLQVKVVGMTEAQAEVRAELFSDPAADDGASPPNANLYYDMFAPELWQGLRMDVNRPFGNGWDDDGDGVVDNPAETTYSGVANARAENNWDYYNGATALSPEMDLDNDHLTSSTSVVDAEVIDPRVRFAKHLYMLALLLTDEVDIDLDGDGNIDAGSYEQTIAQWAINVADFRDPDTIMTRFAYDPNPWDGWAPGAANVVWGVERPELLISEGFAFHDRRVEDTPTADDIASGNDPHFDNRLRPEAGTLIELYNPWTQNRLNQRFDSSLYSSGGVELGRTAGGSPIWRISVERPASRAAYDTRMDHTSTPLRHVYFVNPNGGGSNTAGVEEFFPSTGAISIGPGEQAVVGSVGHDIGGGEFAIPMGRLSGKTQLDEVPDNLDMANTQSIILDPSNEIIKRFPVDADTALNNGERNCKILQIDSPRSFNVSDPRGGYATPTSVPPVAMAPWTQIADGFAYTAPFDEPLDANTDNNRDDDDLKFLWLDDETGENFRYVKLQRLANPLLPYNNTTNEYITVDHFELDLAGFNGTANAGANDSVGLNLTGATPTLASECKSHERGSDDNDRNLWQSGRGGLVPPNPLPALTAPHYFSETLTESLGKTNAAFIDNAATEAFPLLTWNNRPFVNHLELTNVPFIQADWLTKDFTMKEDFPNGSSDDPFAGEDDQVRGRFQHLLNFFAHDGGATPNRANLYRMFDYVEVPSPFLGTEERMNPNNMVNHPFNVVPRYRVPGKINLNTVYDQRVWRGLQNGFDTMNGGVSWNDFQTARNGNSTNNPTDFEHPFRPAGTGENVPDITTTDYGVTIDLSDVGPNSTLFRSDGGTGNQEPLFDFENTNASYNSDRSAYFRNLQRNRLANLTTCRSSVFAIWITVAYFEVDENGLIGAEVGADEGTAIRNRGFYIYDRSIPVGHEPGKNHNIERGILVQSIIE